MKTRYAATVFLTAGLALASTIALTDDAMSPAASSPEPMSRAEVEAIIAAYLQAHPDAIAGLVTDYVVRHPAVVRDVLIEVSKIKAQAQREGAEKLAAERAQIIAREADALFASSQQATLGNPDGDVTLVEFFDYNCAYCRRALADTLALLGADAHLRIILRDLPLLGPQSVDAAQVAIAARRQAAADDRYFAFHRQLLALHQPATAGLALAAARAAGFDMDRLQRDMTSADVATTLKETMRLAGALHITGTPTYVIGGRVFVGAVGLDALKAQIAALRQRKSDAL